MIQSSFPKLLNKVMFNNMTNTNNKFKHEFS